MSGPASPRSESPASKEQDRSSARILLTVRLAVFTSSLFVRAADPIIPEIADGFGMDVATVALLSTAFALPYAAMQPILGAVADVVGKTRLMTFSLAVTAVAGLLAALAPNFSVLLAARIMNGVVAGGVFPVALALAGDLVPVHERQVAVSRLLAAGMLGNVLGSPCAGVIGDLAGWRGVFAVTGSFAAASLVATIIGFRGFVPQGVAKFRLGAIGANYGAILRNPLAKFCYGAVFLEGVLLFGIFPYVAKLLAAAGEPRASIAGLVISGFGLGGIVYSFAVPVLLPRAGEKWLMRSGGCLMGIGLLIVASGVSWPVELLTFAVLGAGFYLLHGVIQIYATELAPHARGAATALHSFFLFIGQGLGPIVYGFSMSAIGLMGMAAIAATILPMVGFVCSIYLRRPQRA